MSIRRPSILGFMMNVGRDTRVGAGLRITCSMLAAPVALGAAFAGAFIVSFIGSNRSRGNDFDSEHIIGSLIAAVILYPLLLLWIWRPVLGQATRLTVLSAALHILLSGAVIGGCLFLTFWIDNLYWLDEEGFLIAACWLLGVPLAIIPWVALAHGLSRGRTMGTDAEQQVVCPACGYSLAGLRQASCPECGTEFTLEELFRRQGYELPASSDALSG